MKEVKEKQRSERQCINCGSEGRSDDFMDFITPEHSVASICLDCAESMGNRAMPKPAKPRQLNLFTGEPEPDEEELELESSPSEYRTVVDYHRFALEKLGYYIGYDWAKEQKELSHLVEFYYEFEQGQLSPARFEKLERMIDPWGIALSEPSEEAPDLREGESILIADESLAAGVMYGVMEFVGEQRYPRRSVDGRKA